MLTRRDDHIENKGKTNHHKGAPKGNSPCCQGKGPCSCQEKQKAFSLRGNKTRVTVHYDCGFQNSLCIRGKGANLSWEQGIPLKNVAADQWIWETDDTFTVAEFKVLINDCEYEAGSNHTIKCGAHIEYTPHFAGHCVG